jgi:hypothetical protein
MVFKLNTDNSIEIMSSDFSQEYVSIENDGDSKIIEISVIEQTLEMNDSEENI